MNNSNFNPNEEIEAMKTTDAADIPENTADAQAIPAAEPTEASVNEATTEAVAQNAEEATPAQAVEAEAEAPSEATQLEAAPSADISAAEAALNAAGEEIDIRRQKPRREQKIKKSRISYEKKKGLYGYGFIAIWIVGFIYMFLIF